MKLLLIVNPEASAVTDKRRKAAERALGEGHDLTVVGTLYRRHAIDLARDGAASGAQVVVVLGGDGTLNEVANGLVGTDAALAALPGGSTNVFARACTAVILALNLLLLYITFGGTLPIAD